MFVFVFSTGKDHCGSTYWFVTCLILNIKTVASFVHGVDTDQGVIVGGGGGG